MQLGKNKKDKMVYLVEEFYKEHGRLPKQKEMWKNEYIGLFLTNIHNGRVHISHEQLNRLLKLGFVFELRKTKKEIKIKLIEDFYDVYKRLPQLGEIIFEGHDIYNFLANVKRGNTNLTEEQMERLKKIGFYFTKEEKKEHKINEIQKFYDIHKKLPPRFFKTEDGIHIGYFLDSVKYGSTIISEEHMSQLQTLGFSTEVKSVEEKKEEKLCQIEAFYQKYHRLPKRDEIAPEGTKIGRFLTSIHEGTTTITEGQMKRLIAIGYSGEIKDPKIQKIIRQIEAFYQLRQRLPYLYEPTYSGAILGDTIFAIQKGKITITKAQLRRLQKMGFVMKKDEMQLSIKQSAYTKK